MRIAMLLFIALVLIICLSLLSLTSSEQKNQQLSFIEVNKQALNASPINSIAHILDETRFSIQINDNIKCNDPFFMLRLSGAALLTPIQEKLSNKEFSFPYKISVTGLYHVEILFFGCDCQVDYADQLLHHCTLTPPEMTINSPYQVQLEAQYDLPGWRLLENQQNQITIHKAVKTRFQREKCINPSPVLYQQCELEGYREWVHSYSYYGLESTHEYFFVLQRLLNQLGPEESFKFCFVGASHSRKLLDAALELRPSLVSKNSNFSRLHFARFEVHVPKDWDLKRVNGLESCSVAVVAMGQWSAAVVPTGLAKPYGAKEFRREMVGLVKHFEKYPDVRFYFRSIHHNGFQAKKMACPPTDWRLPYLIDAYNRELKNLSVEVKIPFIDTDWLLRPLWDASKDYTHIDGKGMEEELRFIFWKIALDFS